MTVVGLVVGLAVGWSGSVGAQTAMAATAPPGYQLVIKNFSAPQSSFTTLDQVSCPAGTATWGGGVDFSAWSPPVTFASSYWDGATPGAWKAAVGNTHVFTASFNVLAACAQQPTGYKFVTKTVDDPPGMVAGGTVKCPLGKVLLSGGLATTSDMTNVYQLSAAPVSARGYRGYQENAGTLDQPFHLYALCAAKPPGYARVTTSVIIAAGTQGGPTSTCPANTSVIGGGLMLNPVAPAAIPEDSSPVPDLIAHNQWSGLVDNTSTSAETVTSVVICAA
jgi:hypothetical protein